MRCNQCGKFVSYEDPPTVEVQSTRVEADTTTASSTSAPATGGSAEAQTGEVVEHPVAESAPRAEAEVAAEAPVEAPEDKPEESVSGSVTLEARVILKCQECGTELAESTIETEADFDHTCDPEGQPDAAYDPAGEQFETNDPEGEGTSRQENKDRNGKPIKNPRYMKTFYGFEAEVDVSCRKCGETFQVNVSGEEQASSFSECQ